MATRAMLSCLQPCARAAEDNAEDTGVRTVGLFTRKRQTNKRATLWHAITGAPIHTYNFLHVT